MATLVCSECHADLDVEAIEASGRWECPFCGTALPDSARDFITEVQSTDDSPRGEIAAGTSNSPPEGSRIQVSEATEQRLVLFVPPGGKESGGFGCLALFWNLFMVVFTSVWITANKLEWPVIGFLALFWLVGLGILVAWIKMRFERTLLLIEPTRAVVQHILFNRKRLIETELTPSSRAMLAEAYRQNDVPVYSVAISGGDRTLKFGTSLSNAEKDWLVDRINEFLGPNDTPEQQVESFPEQCPACGTVLGAHLVNLASGSLTCPSCLRVYRAPATLRETNEPTIEEDPTGEFPADRIQVEEDSPERLRFSVAALEYGWVRLPVMIFAGLFSLVWYSGLIGFFVSAWQAPDIVARCVATLVLLVFGTAGLMPLGLSLFVWRGRITVDLDRERLACRWHVGPFGFMKTVPTDSIQHVRVAVPPEQNPRAVPRHAPATMSAGPKACFVQAGSKFLLLTLLNEEHVSRHVAALVRRKLDEFRR